MKACIAVLATLAGLAAIQAGKPINATCPVKGPKYASKPDITVLHEGQLIGFC